MTVPVGQAEGDDAAFGVGAGMDFRRSPASAAANSLLLTKGTFVLCANMAQLLAGQSAISTLSSIARITEGECLTSVSQCNCG